MAVVTALFTLSFASVASARVSRVEARTVGFINLVRAHYGLPAVHVSSHMSVGADRHSMFMARTRSAGHGAWATRVSHYAHSRTIGEIIAWISGGRGQAARVVRMWMNSPPHRAVILNGRYRRVGVGRRSSHGVAFYTIDFAR